MLCYCKKCGRIILYLFDKDERVCDCCKSKVFPIPKQYLSSEFSIKKGLEQQFVNQYVKTSPEFDQYLFDHRDEILKNQSAELNAKMEHGKAVLEAYVKCPYCHSTNTKKIHYISWLGMVGKQFHCNSCNANF